MIPDLLLYLPVNKKPLQGMNKPRNIYVMLLFHLSVTANFKLLVVVIIMKLLLPLKDLFFPGLVSKMLLVTEIVKVLKCRYHVRLGVDYNSPLEDSEWTHNFSEESTL